MGCEEAGGVSHPQHCGRLPSAAPLASMPRGLRPPLRGAVGERRSCSPPMASPIVATAKGTRGRGGCGASAGGPARARAAGAAAPPLLLCFAGSSVDVAAPSGPAHPVAGTSSGRPSTVALSSSSGLGAHTVRCVASPSGLASLRNAPSPTPDLTSHMFRLLRSFAFFLRVRTHTIHHLDARGPASPSPRHASAANDLVRRSRCQSSTGPGGAGLP